MVGLSVWLGLVDFVENHDVNKQVFFSLMKTLTKSTAKKNTDQIITCIYLNANEMQLNQKSSLLP